MWTKGRVAAATHLIRYCSISCNKCRRLSDSVESRHVSNRAPFCQLACLRLSSPPAEESFAMLISPPQHTYNASPQITTLSSSFLSFLPNCFSSSPLIHPVLRLLVFFSVSFFFLPPTLLLVFLTPLCCGVTGSRASGSARVGESGLSRRCTAH